MYARCTVCKNGPAWLLCFAEQKLSVHAASALWATLVSPVVRDVGEARQADVGFIQLRAVLHQGKTRKSAKLTDQRYVFSCRPWSIHVRHILPTSNIDVLIYYLFSVDITGQQMWELCPPSLSQSWSWDWQKFDEFREGEWGWGYVCQVQIVYVCLASGDDPLCPPYLQTWSPWLCHWRTLFRQPQWITPYNISHICICSPWATFFAADSIRLVYFGNVVCPVLLLSSEFDCYHQLQWLMCMVHACVVCWTAAWWNTTDNDRHQSKVHVTASRSHAASHHREFRLALWSCYDHHRRTCDRVCRPLKRWLSHLMVDVT